MASIPDALDAELTTADVARYLQCTTQTVRRYRRKGHFPNAWRTDGQWRIPMSDVRAYQQRQVGQ